MLKTLKFVAGVVMFASLVAAAPSAASAHHLARFHRAAAGHVRIVRVRTMHAPRMALVHFRRGRLHSRTMLLASRGFRHHRGRYVLAPRPVVVAPRYASATPVFGGFFGAPAAAPAVVVAPAPARGVQVGGASYYGGGGRTANGGSVGAATCAHRTLPFGTRILVTNLTNARKAVLTVNDRGPFVRGRIVDVSVGAAATLGMLHSGTARVSLQVVGGPA